MIPQRKVLFCYISPTSGHQRAAEAVMNVLRHRHPPVPCEGVNSVSYANPVFGKFVSRLYLQVLKHAPQVWDVLYDNPIVEKATRDIRDLMHIFNTGRIADLLRQHRPRCIVCTQAIPVGLLSALKARGKIRTPLVGILTDFGVHKYWISPEVDLYLTPSEEIRRRVIRLGVPESRVRVTGIPVDPHFGARGDKGEERRALGLSPTRPTVLVMGGNYGLGPVEDAVHALRHLPLGLQFIVVGGTNRRLVRSLNARFGDDRHVRVLGHTRTIHRLMDASDVLISKPGGLTTSEALAKGLPMIIIEPIPGQEERNAQFLLRHGAAVRADTLDELVRSVGGLFNHRGRLEQLRENGRALARPWAARDAAEAIVSLMEERRPARSRAEGHPVA
ncbi:MAG: glycosyltransferase [Elusimicrobia bacterium]|nr:glycosyltransferase [Elusimicrobiota bacterium]MBK7545520.1 glycosyltransferase [Elusimicrobiota bacterium]MBK7575289.1 glycosyltransferase [Elusimicrobiota bacterium]MBK7687930.1 glycosyltransferase [Elusimicrobiota bacterium]MBK8125153.1 glycosyltransferase [Elusimicrobiota bacterium]